MNVEQFFEKFELIADAPNAVQKMRELVLSFAVTGRLSEQRIGDAPVSELVDALLAGQARFGRNRRRGASKAVPSASVADRPVNAPAHWAWLPLNEIGAMSGGMTPSKNKSAFWDGNVNWFSSKDVKTDELTESELKITRKATEETGLQVYSPGSLVMVARSGILKRTFPASILRVEGTVNQDLKVLSPFVGGIERYLQIMLRGLTEFILTALVKTGMTVQSLKYEEFEAQPFPLPPLAEQKRIVAKVDELMALCDQLEAQQQEREAKKAGLARAALARFAEAPTPANLEFIFHKSYDITPADLRKSILTLAVQGKLVSQDPGDEPVENLFTKMEKERREFSTAHRFRSTVAESVDPASAPFAIPTTWKWCRLSSMFNAVTDGDHLPPPKSDGGIAFLTIGNITTGRIDFAGSRFVPDSYYRGLADFRRPTRGDILYTVVGATYGRPAFVDTDRELCVQRHIAILKPLQCIEVGFLMTVLRSPLAYAQASAATTGTAQPTIPLGSLRNFAAPLPPRAEQRRIVARVAQLMGLVDILEKQLTEVEADANNLLDAILHEIKQPGEDNQMVNQRTIKKELRPAC